MLVHPPGTTVRDEPASSITLNFLALRNQAQSPRMGGREKAPRVVKGLFFIPGLSFPIRCTAQRSLNYSHSDAPSAANPAGSDVSRLLWATAPAQSPRQAARARCGV